MSPQFGRNVTSSPVVDEAGNIYLGSQDHQIYRLDADGEIAWSYRTGDWILGSSPLLTNQHKLLIASMDGFAYSVDTGGKQQWSYRLSPPAGAPSREAWGASPTVTGDGALCIGSRVMENGERDRQGSVLHSFWPDGTLRWQVELDGQQHGCPAVTGDGVLIVTTSRNTYALDEHGKQQWKLAVGSYGSPVITSQAILMTGSEPNFGSLFAVNQAGKILWRRNLHAWLSTPALAEDGTGYIGCKDGIRAISTDGRVKWHACKGLTAGSPTVDRDGNVYIGFLGGWLYSLTPQGKVRWKLKLEGNPATPPVIGAPGRAYVGTDDRHLYAIE